MTKLPKILLLFSSLFGFLYLPKAGAQTEKREETVKFGLGFKMVASSDVLSGGAATFFRDGVTFSYQPRLSYGIDAKIRFRLKNRFSFETGISSLRRAYNFEIFSDSLAFDGFLRQPSYQIPFVGLLQVPISENTKVGIETGFIEEMLPSEIGSGDKDYYAFVYLQSRLKTSLRAGAHINYTTKNKAAIELGFAYNRMLGRLGSFYMDYDPLGSAGVVTHKGNLQGHFFSVNLSFFFP